MSKARALMFLLATLLFHLYTGDAQKSCDKSDITIKVLKISTVIQKQQVYIAVFRTSCSCKMKDVHFSCDGLQNSIVDPDRNFVDVDRSGMCTLQRTLTMNSPLQIMYSSETPVNFRVLSVTPAC
uniref:Uncharacterized protein n=1 Tax=Avena sativa TaxID=4498 RepID=A0ACD6A399_AVESA